MTTSKSLCFIPAKAASVRLKKKNLKKLDGKELIYYPIHNAIASNLFDQKDIILSSESEEIKAVAKKHGAHVPYLRDAKLAVDPYGVKDVLLDFFDRFPKYKTYESTCILLPTAPLMEPIDIQKAFDVFEKGNFDVVMSVNTTEHSALRAVFVRDGKVEPVLPKFINKKSGELEPTYRINGAICIVRTAAFLQAKSYFMESWGAYVMPSERSVDIDTAEDFRYAEYLVGRRKLES